ncbi:diacylglycerol kinase family enzyme [Neolewinella xylanilytica]|uniref:Diacylglycerol kinase family enzyme n=1 Tax=Neolewinella xylanilytica TaxID=1514080 RepID=A0A2S6IAQ3_9BACT|nr:diacylglycerol kinase family protein [Neolewinella xylanilytica]PPK88584.1 diacylglycerol kinase family enzyme [Neolewinella xylanilytica]
MFDRPHFIVNPAAAGGRAAAWWRAAEPVIRKRVPECSATVAAKREDIYRTLQRTLESGPRDIIGVGGDGTHHDVVNALIKLGALNECTYAPLPVGSGNDWCRTLAVPRHLLRWFQTMEKGWLIDHRIGQLSFPSGPPRYFINVAGMAYDAEVVRRAEQHPFKHRLTYPLLTAAHLAGFTPPRLSLTYDGECVTDRFHTINLGIGRYNGGGMRLVPQANPLRDSLALTYARALPLHRIALNGWRFFTDSIGAVRGVTTTHATSVRVDGLTGVEADGEYLGTGPVVAELLPVTLRVRCGRTAF